MGDPCILWYFIYYGDMYTVWCLYTCVCVPFGDLWGTRVYSGTLYTMGTCTLYGVCIHVCVYLLVTYGGPVYTLVLYILWGHVHCMVSVYMCVCTFW